MIGGMEKQNYALSQELSKKLDTTIISWGKSQKYLPFFLVKAFVQSLYIIPAKKITHVHLGDGLLAPLGLVLKFIYPMRCSTTVHGLDVTYSLPVYQRIIPGLLGRLDKLICVSNATSEECVKRRIPKSKLEVIPNGIYPDEFYANGSRKDLSSILPIDAINKKVIITVGRLVKRKGVYWFIKNVFPKLSEDYLYAIVGDGIERERIQRLISDLHLTDRVFLLGKISDSDLKLLYNTADLFVMPNIPVKGDIEGFGIVVIEASSVGLPVIAADIEGLQDAVIQGKTGLLVESKNAQGFVNAILKSETLKKETVRKETIKRFSWKTIAMQYIKSFD